jgi:putative hemolysin
MKRMGLMALAGLATLAGCVTVNSVQPFGKDTYMMPATLSSAGNVRMANEYCAKRGPQMQPQSLDFKSFVFQCVDAEHARPVTWGSAPENVNVTVEP